MPVLHKETLVANYQQILTDPAVRVSELEDFIAEPATASRIRFFRDDYAVRFTGGTTGVRLALVQDRAFVAQSVALFLTRALRMVHDDTGRPKWAWVAANDHRYPTSFMPAFIPEALVECTILSGEWPASEILERLLELAPDFLLTYPFTAARLAALLEQSGGKLGLKHLICAGESFSESLRERLVGAFDCPVRQAYACLEGGPMALECSHARLHIQEDVVVLEVVDDQDAPLTDGEMGDHVLLTSLSNRIVPLIRYRLDDRLKIGVGPCPCGSPFRWIDTIEGRGGPSAEFVAPSADGGVTIVGWKIVSALISRHRSIAAAQVIHAAERALRINIVIADSGTVENAVLDEARRIAETYLAEQGADVSSLELLMNRVDELERTPGSNKVASFRSMIGRASTERTTE